MTESFKFSFESMTTKEQTEGRASALIGLAPKARSQESLGQRPRSVIGFSASAEGAIQDPEMNRAFSAGGLYFWIPGALPQAGLNTAPLALTTSSARPNHNFSSN